MASLLGSSSSSSCQSLLFCRQRDFTAFPPSQSRSRNLSIRASANSESVVTLLDYGAGNVRSVRNAIRSLGFEIKDVQRPEDILDANRLVFPGVGAFAAAMDVLSQRGLIDALSTYIQNDRPFLGICLGLQLLFESSEENGPGLTDERDREKVNIWRLLSSILTPEVDPMKCSIKSKQKQFDLWLLS